MVEFFENLFSNLTLGQAFGIVFGGAAVALVIILLFFGWKEDPNYYE